MRKNKGFVMTLVLIIAALALLKYFFNWSIFDAAASEQGRTTISYIRDVLNTIWSYIGRPVTFAWQEVVKPLLQFAFDSLRQMLDGARGALNQ